MTAGGIVSTSLADGKNISDITQTDMSIRALHLLGYQVEFNYTGIFAKGSCDGVIFYAS